MAYELLVGLDVSNTETYENYRSAIMPILSRYGGGFRYDFKIAETLKAETGDPINRVFAIFFQDEKSMKEFFSNPEYLKAKAHYFESSVRHTTIISEYTRAR